MRPGKLTYPVASEATDMFMNWNVTGVRQHNHDRITLGADQRINVFYHVLTGIV